MKELDKEASELQKELAEMEQSYLSNLESLKLNRTANILTEELIEETKQKNSQLMNDMMSLRVRCKQKLTEKTAMATNLTNIIDRFGRKLDSDLAFFETELKGCGDFETPKGAEPGSEVNNSLSNI